jgi:hypothetical protein
MNLKPALTKAVMREARQQLKVKQLRREKQALERAKAVVERQRDEKDEDLASALATINQQAIRIEALESQLAEKEALEVENYRLREQREVDEEALRQLSDLHAECRRLHH